MDQEFRPLMMELVKLYKPQTYVEVGVKHGYTFNWIAPMVPRAVGIDNRNVEKYINRNPGAEFHCVDSQEFAKTWKDPIDLLFIDADHRFESVLKDFNAWSKFLTYGTGLCLLHDTHPMTERFLEDDRCSSAWRFAHVMRASEAYNQHFEIVTLPGPVAGLSIVRRIDWERHLSWKE